jgi:serine protease AprX
MRAAPVAGLAVVAVFALLAPFPARIAEEPLGLKSGGESIFVLVFDEARGAEANAWLQGQDWSSVTFDRLSMAAVLAPVTAASDLRKGPGIERVWQDESYPVLLDESVPYVAAPDVWRQGQEGANATIFVLDTGIDATHPDLPFGSKVVQNVIPVASETGLPVTYMENVPNSDTHRHGIHVAGIAAGTGEASGGQGQGFVGGAPASKLVGFNAGRSLPGGGVSLTLTGLLAGYEYALQHQETYGLRVIVNSWGAQGEFQPDHPLNEASLDAYEAGFAIFAAAGNNGTDGPGHLNRFAVAPWVMAIGAGTLDDQRAPFSSTGTDPDASGLPYDHVDLLAPGVRITAARAKTSLEPPGSTQDALYITLSGTSMAAPHVAGAAALLLSHRPDFSPDNVYDTLAATARPLEAPPWETGAGYLDVAAAFAEAPFVAGNRDAFLAGERKYAGPASGDPEYARSPIRQPEDRPLQHTNTTAPPEPQETDLTLTVEPPRRIATLAPSAAAAILVVLALRWRRGRFPPVA